MLLVSCLPPAFFTAEEKVTNTTEFNQEAAQTRASVLVMGRHTWSQTLIKGHVMTALQAFLPHGVRAQAFHHIGWTIVYLMCPAPPHHHRASTQTSARKITMFLDVCCNNVSSSYRYHHTDKVGCGHMLCICLDFVCIPPLPCINSHQRENACMRLVSCTEVV